MTPQDLRRIDALVAEKVMGLQPCTFRITGQMSGWATIWGCQHEFSGACFPTNKTAVEHQHSLLRHYTNSDGDAGQIIAHWEGDVRIGRQNGSWWVEFSRPSEEFREWADTFPLAVSLAALKAVGAPVSVGAAA